MILFNAKNLSHKFDYLLFKNISLTLSSKESIAIIGASGSGKSTLLHILSSLLEPTSGSVELLNENVYKIKNSKLVALRKNDLGLVFQSHYLFKGFSAYENLEIATMLSKQNIENSLLENLNIDNVINQQVTELSGGQQQRVSIARVLSKKPQIIFADEPTGNLDKTTAVEVIELFHNYINEYNAGLVMVTHDEELAFSCQKVYRLENFELKQVK
jgi:putative ABC transport system ATP-binding protein